MSSEYRHNHYVPVWYQKRFIPPLCKERVLFYLDLKSPTYTDKRGVAHPRRYRYGPKQCFAETDLYTARFGAFESTEIEKVFFGEIDTKGKDAVEHFANFDIGGQRGCNRGDAFQSLLTYLTTQRLRTPKGLDWLQRMVRSKTRNQTLMQMTHLHRIFGAIWTECIWQIADASKVNTKFLITDHPVTSYNRGCGPQWCRRNGDHDIRLCGTHTIFPLDLDKILILTNLSWVRNPYQDPKTVRPNPRLARSAIMHFRAVQTRRFLSEEEVTQINFILKAQASRYVAAGNPDWLYPENYVQKSDWARYGDGYLLMPDPRNVEFSGELIMGFEDGSATGYDEYGRRPWEKAYRQRDGTNEWNSFQRFRGEFARLCGPSSRGRAADSPEDWSEEYHRILVRGEEFYRRQR